MIEKIEVVRKEVKDKKREIRCKAPECPNEYCWHGCFGNLEWHADTYYLHFDVANWLRMISIGYGRRNKKFLIIWDINYFWKIRGRLNLSQRKAYDQWGKIFFCNLAWSLIFKAYNLSLVIKWEPREKEIYLSIW